MLCTHFILFNSRTSATEEATELIRLFDWDKYFKYRQIYPGKKTTHFSRYVVCLTIMLLISPPASTL